MAHDGAGYEDDVFLGLRKRGNQWQVQVKWRGWAAGDKTREPLENLMTDVPVLLVRWLKSIKTKAAR